MKKRIKRTAEEKAAAQARIEELRAHARRIEAEIAGAALPSEDIYYWGLAPGFAGLYQFNLRIPATAAAGDAEVRVGIAGEWSQPGFRIAVAGP